MSRPLHPDTLPAQELKLAHLMVQARLSQVDRLSLVGYDLETDRVGTFISSSAEGVTQFGKDVPLGRAGQPEEIAPCYVFLACEDASYITGQVLHPNGGEIVNA